MSPAPASSRPSRRPRPRHRVVLVVAVCALALATCAQTIPGAGEGAPVEPARLESRSVAARFAPGDLALRRPRAGTSARPSPPAPVPDQPGDRMALPDVTVARPTIRLTGGAGDRGDTDLAALADAVEGVTFATVARVARLALAPGGVVRRYDVAAVDPAELRRVVPQVTADALDVWRRLAEGDAAFSHDAGHELEAEARVGLGGSVPLASGEATLRVGAYASTGAPPVADAVVSRRRAAELGLEGETVVLVVTAPGADPLRAAAALETATGMDAEVLPEPVVQRAFLSGGETAASFEPFAYLSLGDGMIQMERAWVERNIESADVPVLRGRVRCHRLLIPQLRAALADIAEAGLAELIDPDDYGGCWVPRHILFDPDRGISMHAWGLAIDLNVATNGYGETPRMDPRVVEIFERWGFHWGGRWSVPDGMHFELAALVADAGR